MRGECAQAFALLDEHKEEAAWRTELYDAYAAWLRERGDWEAAQEALHRAGRQSAALQLLSELSANAVTQARFHDASHYAWRLSLQMLELAASALPSPPSTPAATLCSSLQSLLISTVHIRCMCMCMCIDLYTIWTCTVQCTVLSE